jgi:hypothetical protein
MVSVDGMFTIKTTMKMIVERDHLAKLERLGLVNVKDLWKAHEGDAKSEKREEKGRELRIGLCICYTMFKVDANCKWRFRIFEMTEPAAEMCHRSFTSDNLEGEGGE